MTRARIARISTVPFFVVTQLRRQIQDIATSGAEVTVITSAGPELDTIEWNEQLRHETIEIPRQFRPLQDVIALCRLTMAFSRTKFDIIHSTTPKAGLLAMLAGWLAGVPVRLHTFTGQTWVTLTGPMRHLARLADRLIGVFATHCYADSASQRDFLIANGIVPAHRIEVLGHGSLAGIDVSRFEAARLSPQQAGARRREMGIADGTRVVLFVGRICEDKGVGELLDAFDLVLQRGIAAQLLLLGPLDTRQPSLSARSILARPCVRHIDFTPLPEYYMAIADVLALPSYREGFGTVIIEAASMGVPSVGSRIYGLSDAIVDGETGILVPPRDAQGLADALTRLLTDEAARSAMAAAGIERSRTCFDSETVSAAVLAEYDRFVQRTRDL